MTAKQLYEAVLIELNKDNASNILLEDFNYFANKAINQFVNKRYNLYDINQQTTDDLRVLKASSILTPERVPDTIYSDLTNAKQMATYEVILPYDYLHILNCICVYETKKRFKCYDVGTKVRFPATRLTADGYSQVIDNFWNKPSYKRPYYYIHNVNTSTEVPTDLVGSHSNSELSKKLNLGTDTDANTATQIIIIGGSWWSGSEEKAFFDEKGIHYDILGVMNNILDSFNGETITAETGWDILKLDTKILVIDQQRDKTIISPLLDRIDLYNMTLSWLKALGESSNKDFRQLVFYDPFKIHLDTSTSNVEREAYIRYGNASQIRMEIRYGTDASLFQLQKVYIDYIKSPQNIRLTQEQLDYTEDMSQVLEWPDYVCQEIVNELVHLIMENIGDPKLQTHPLVTLSIATQQLTPVQAATAAQ